MMFRDLCPERAPNTTRATCWLIFCHCGFNKTKAPYCWFFRNAAVTTWHCAKTAKISEYVLYKFPSFLWRTVTGAAQKRMLQAVLGSYVLQTPGTTWIYRAILWPYPDCQVSSCSHVLWSSIEHPTRRCHHPRCCDDSHRSGVEGYPPWEASLSRSDWAQSPQSGAAPRQLNHRWCWDTWRSRALGCWIPSDCHIHKERSGSRYNTWHPYRGMFCGEDSLQRDKYFRGCLPKLTSASFSHNPWVCDSDWDRCLWKLPLSGEHHLGWVCDSHWDRCLSRLHLSGEHHLGWVCDSHWGQCLWRLHFSCKHHFGWVCDSHWDRCLFRLHLSGEHHLGWVCDSDWGRCLWRLHLSGEHHNSRVIEAHFEERNKESFRDNHHHPCKAGQETMTRGVSECTDLFWCHLAND